MVSFQRDSELAQQLHNDPLTMAFEAGGPERPGFAMVAVTDPLVLDGLAAAAHAASEHACGNLQYLTLRTLRGPDELTPPVFDTPVASPAVAALLAEPRQANIEASITALAKLGTRYHTTETGLQTTDKVQELFTTAIAGKLPDARFEQISHAAFADGIATQQKSLVLTLPGVDDDATTVVLGAHLDSINRQGATFTAPGADDDASGIATLVEVVRVLAAHGATFSRRVELHAYGAEEVGLIGSADLAQRYADAGRRLGGMMQIDMNSYAADPAAQTIHFVTNDTSPTLSRNSKDLMNVYLGGDYVEQTLTAGTSDHRSWTRNGFAAVFPFEDAKLYNHKLHTADDTLGNANNRALSERFAKLAIAFLAHHAGLKSAAAGYDAARLALRTATPKDLQLAVQESESPGYFDVAVAAPAAVTKVELCVVHLASAMGCTAESTTTTHAKDDGERAFFGTDTPQLIADGSRLAIFGYDAADKLVAQRTVHFGAKK